MDEVEQVGRILDGGGGVRNTLQFVWLALGPFAMLALYGLYRWLYRNPRGPDRPHFSLFFSFLPEAADEEFRTQPASISGIDADSTDPAGNQRAHHYGTQPWGPVDRVAAVMGHFRGTWAIAGGWALDLLLGEVTRPHEDIEVAIPRREQEQLSEFLIGWHPKYVIPGETGEPVPWQPGLWLELPIHEIHTTPPQSDIVELEFLLNEVEHDEWIYRRDPRIRLPLTDAILAGRGDVPCLAPEIVLLYKSKQPRPKDERDFDLALGVMSFEAQQWLRDSIRLIDPQHHWLKRF